MERRGSYPTFFATAWARELKIAGKSEKEIEDIVSQGREDTLANRATINGKAVNVYGNPEAVKDPNFTPASGKIGFGFDLDKKGAGTPDSFEEAETHEKGVDNQAARALGCFHAFRANYPERSSNWELWWGLASDSTPAWLITIVAEDFTKDGDATLTFERSLDHTTRDANSRTRADATFRIDPNPTSRSVFRGRIKDGTFTSIEPTTVSMIGDALVLPHLQMHQARIRLKLKPDGSIDGVLGGYQPWRDIYFGMGGGNGFGYESNIGANVPAAYYLLKRLADAEPDPKTGQNTAISATWRIEGVRAKVAPAVLPSRSDAAANR